MWVAASHVFDLFGQTGSAADRMHDIDNDSDSDINTRRFLLVDYKLYAELLLLLLALLNYIV